MADVKISVVVPVYNAAAYLSGTLDALACQSFRDFEVILVDDGSTDESPEFIDRRCREDGRFRAMHIPNGGVYNARLRGIREAKGAYIAFCDSDDLYLPDMLERLYAQAEKTGADVTVCGYIREEAETGRIFSREMLIFGEKTLDRPAFWDILPRVNPTVWNKLYRAELLRHAIVFDRPPRVAEDLLFNVSLLPFLRRMAFVPEPYYRYRVRAGSAVSRVTEADCGRMREALLRTRDYVLQYEDLREMRALLDNIAFVHVGCSLVTFRINGGAPIGKTVASARKWLEQHMPGYKKAGHSLSWNRKHAYIQLRILLVRWIFRAHLMEPALLAYRLFTRILGDRFKW